MKVVAPSGDRCAVQVTLSDGTRLPADLVLLSVGVRPETTLSQAAGLTLGERDAVRVDEHLRTSAPGARCTSSRAAISRER